MTHPTRETMALLAYGFLSPAEEAAARAHLAECPACHIEWSASRGEAASVKAAFEPAQSARLPFAAWWPAAAGFAAALVGGLVIHAMTGGHVPGASQRPAAERAVLSSPVAPPRTGVVLRAEWAGARYRVQSEARWTLVEGNVLLANWGDSEAQVDTESSAVIFPIRAEVFIQEKRGESAVLCRQGSAKFVANRVTLDLGIGDAAAVVPGAPPVLLRASENADQRLKDLRDRIAALEHSVAALPRAGVDTESPAAVGAWLAKRSFDDPKTGEELGRLWARTMREGGLTGAELEAGTAREELIAGFLEARGCPLSAEKRAAWDAEMADHARAWQQYVEARPKLSGLDKALAQARVAAGRGPRYDALLDDTQRKALADLEPAFLGWRGRFAPVFNVVVGIGGPEKALEQVGAMAGGMPDRAKEIEREMLDACLALHRSADPLDPAGEQAALLDLLATTRDRLVNDAGLAPERANSLLVNFVEGAKK